jgi:hypothetical protein
MQEADAVFRQRLVAVMSALNSGEARDPALVRVVGGFAHQIARQLGAKNWADLKARADGPTYDHILSICKTESEKFQKAGNTKGVRGLEALALSLIARHQKQGDLIPGVGFLDRYIEECSSRVRPAAKVVVNTPRTTKH